MPAPISAIRPPASIAPLPSVTPAKPSGVEAFQSVLSDAIKRVDQVQQNSKTVMEKFLSGEDEEVHKVALSAEEAEISFSLFMQMRNKVVSAYQEVMRMQM